MASNDDLFKREEDQKWRTKVNHEQITLMTGHHVMADRIEELDDKLDELDNLLRGDPAKETGGLIEQIHDLQNATAKLSAAVFMDSTGKRGLVHDVDVLMGRKGFREQSAARLWTFWTAVVTALISSGALLLTKWDQVSKAVPWHQLPKIAPKPAAKHAKPKRRPVVVPPAPIEDEEDE